MFITTVTSSSLINEVCYDSETKELTVKFIKYYTDKITYYDVPILIYTDFISSDSIGKYYIKNIKPNFSQTKKPNVMADKPKTVNESSNEMRFIKMSIDTSKIKKDWIHVGEKGRYMNITLHLKPNGELDAYGNLGMITQDVPKSIYENDKKAVGPILGNGCEFERFKPEGTPGSETGKLADKKAIDDLPF